VVRVNPPVPLMAPENPPPALLSVSVLPPKVTVPPPDRLPIDAPAVVPWMSNVPLSATFEVPEILPVVVTFNAAPLPMVVAPV
jgi:hypothetical protein